MEWSLHLASRTVPIGITFYHILGHFRNSRLLLFPLDISSTLPHDATTRP